MLGSLLEIMKSTHTNSHRTKITHVAIMKPLTNRDLRGR